MSRSEPTLPEPPSVRANSSGAYMDPGPKQPRAHPSVYDPSVVRAIGSHPTIRSIQVREHRAHKRQFPRPHQDPEAAFQKGPPLLIAPVIHWSGGKEVFGHSATS